MSKTSVSKESHKSLSESFLNYLNTGINEPFKTYCEGKNSKYHDSIYIWYRVCDKIFCTQCSFNHLLNNQINHNVNQNIFLRKEHLDVEFKVDYQKVDELKNKIIDFLNKKNSVSIADINNLKETLKNFTSLANELVNNIIPKFVQKYNELINNLQKAVKEANSYKINQNNLNNRCKEIIIKLENIKKNYANNDKFEPKMIKSYYEDLNTSYREAQNLNELIEKNIENSNDSNCLNCIKEYDSIRNNLNQAVNIINSFKKDLNCHLNN